MKINLMKGFIVVGIICIIGLLTAIAWDPAAGRFEFGNGDDCAPVSYKHGVYYLPCVGKNFGIELSKLKKNNPHSEISAMICRSRGCFVAVSQKESCYE